MTKQKALLLSIFRSELCKGEHRTADEILLFARERMPGISRATVYNNLKDLENEGLIRKISGENGADMYDSAFELHGHMICKMCKSVSDIDVPNLLDKMKELSSYLFPDLFSQIAACKDVKEINAIVSRRFQ